MAFDPTGYGTLGWAVLSFGLHIVIQEKTIRDLVFQSSEYLSNLIARYASYEALYLGSVQGHRTPALIRFEESVIVVYERVLLYLCEVKKNLKENYACRFKGHWNFPLIF